MTSRNEQKNKFVLQALHNRRADEFKNASQLMTKEHAEAVFLETANKGQFKLIGGKYCFPHDNPELIAAIIFLGKTNDFIEEFIKLDLKRLNITPEDDENEDFDDYEN
jgi:hypothetical protein